MSKKAVPVNCPHLNNTLFAYHLTKNLLVLDRGVAAREVQIKHNTRLLTRGNDAAILRQREGARYLFVPGTLS